MKKIDLRECSEDELSLQVFNDEHLYYARHKSYLIELLHERFLFTDDQYAVLEQDLKDDLND